MHPFSKKDAQEGVAAAGPVKPVFREFRMDIACVRSKLKQLQEYSLSGRVLPHEDRQITEFDVGTADLPDIFQA